jgi:hypothetical protein
MVPLGDAWSGNCHADPECPSRPEESALISHCNLGYASACPHFPGNGSPQATRFSVTRDQNGVIRLDFVLERDYLPVEHGPLVYSRESRTFVVSHASALVQRQAEAYLESYLRRKTVPHHAETQTRQ